MSSQKIDQRVEGDGEGERIERGETAKIQIYTTAR